MVNPPFGEVGLSALHHSGAAPCGGIQTRTSALVTPLLQILQGQPPVQASHLGLHLSAGLPQVLLLTLKRKKFIAVIFILIVKRSHISSTP